MDKQVRLVHVVAIGESSIPSCETSQLSDQFSREPWAGATLSEPVLVYLHMSWACERPGAGKLTRGVAWGEKTSSMQLMIKDKIMWSPTNISAMNKLNYHVTQVYTTRRHARWRLWFSVENIISDTWPSSFHIAICFSAYTQWLWDDKAMASRWCLHFSAIW